MNEREYLIKAQDADALANLVQDQREQRRWEGIAKEYRKLAQAAAAVRRGKIPGDSFDD